ncbi:MAG: hypothetical protein ACP5T3_01060 [Candidatus Micrarchaeia archaeon]
MELPNIYRYKNLKLLIAVPLVLMLIGIYFSFHIGLDSSLRGGISIQLGTNVSLDPSALAGKISSQMHITDVEVSKSPGGLEITLPINQSLATADSYLSQFYTQESNYSAVQLNYTDLSIMLNNNPNNTTLHAELANDSRQLSAYMSQMKYAASQVFAALSSFGIAASNFSTPGQMQTLLQNAYANASNIYEHKILAELSGIVPYTSYSFQEVTPTLGSYFLSQFKNIILIAFVLVFISVFFIFRSFIPSITVTFGAANDMIIALGAMGLFGIPLGVASIAGLLMIIGYAIDTDILAAIRLLKRGEGSVEERAYSSMRTGLTMTSTALLSFLVLFIISIVVYVPTYYEISSVVIMGLLGDIVTTWLGNTPLLMLYKKHKERI